MHLDMAFFSFKSLLMQGECWIHILNTIYKIVTVMGTNTIIWLLI